jgi:hypothetical protein
VHGFGFRVVIVGVAIVVVVIAVAVVRGHDHDDGTLAGVGEDRPSSRRAGTGRGLPRRPRDARGYV